MPPPRTPPLVLLGTLVPALMALGRALVLPLVLPLAVRCRV